MKPSFKASIAAGLLSLSVASIPFPALAQKATVRMWTFLNPAGTTPREVTLAKIVSDFQAANPDIEIVTETHAFDQLTPKFLAAHGAGKAPDIIWAATDFLGDAIGAGSLADLNDLFIKKWTPEQIADRKGPYWDLTNRNGKQYALFTSRNYISILYRPDFFKEAGLDPATIKTWDDFVKAAKALTVTDTSGQIVRYGFAQGYSEHQADPLLMIPMVLASGEGIFKKDGRANFASPAGVAAMKFQTDLIKEHKVSPPQAATWTVDDVYEQFASGRAAMILGASVRVSTLQSKLGDDKVGMMLWPGSGDVKHAPAVMAGWAVGVWSGSKVKAQAGKFVEYMLGPDGDKLWVTSGGQSPGLQSTLNGLGDFTKQPGKAYLNVASEGSANYGWLAPIDFSAGGYRQALNKAGQRILVNGEDVKTSLERAEAEFNRQHKR
ncbi:ABC transporter substrate-binding protein [Microvirga brassicacearum]|uniref:Sugar ABC transporter substrate-binding protein n=1 Tax=Microvirga brassicacearum TaxID=2580413 RepID=A0A5N3P6V5_9HYPH|nr:sugar ABC transporter substrate-binding protein [Microvirga brassicacearum]KAB0265460.1 sugar ABC transporter substrate-binding protein [Microvirga brassicacearum]